MRVLHQLSMLRVVPILLGLHWRMGPPRRSCPMWPLSRSHCFSVSGPLFFKHVSGISELSLLRWNLCLLFITYVLLFKLYWWMSGSFYDHSNTTIPLSFPFLTGFHWHYLFFGCLDGRIFKGFALETDIISLDLSDGLLYIRISAHERSSLIVASGYVFADRVSVWPGSVGPLWNEMILQLCSYLVAWVLIRHQFGHIDLAKHQGSSLDLYL